MQAVATALVRRWRGSCAVPSALLSRPAATLASSQPALPSPSLSSLVARVAASSPAPASCPVTQSVDWEVVRIDATGQPSAVRVSAASLGLAPRDAGLFSRGAGGAATLAAGVPGRPDAAPAVLPAQRATLVSRIVRVGGSAAAAPPGATPPSHRGLILLRTEAVRALIATDEAFIFPARRERDTETLLESVRDAVRSAAAAVGAAPATAPVDGGAAPPPPPSSSSTRLPFELAVLEALLAETVRQFERRHRQLRLVADGVADDVRRALRGGSGRRSLLSTGGGGGGGGADEDGGGGSSSTSTVGFTAAAASMSGLDAGAEVGRLLPIQIALQEVRHDVREAAAAVAEVADSDALLSAICLSDHDYSAGRDGGGVGGKRASPPPHAHVAAALLEAYERQIETVASAVRELEENTLSLQAALAMGLDAHRNSIMFLNATMTICSLSVAACALPATWFGANLASGLEDTAGVFWPLVGWSVAGAAALGAAIAVGWRRWPRAAAAARAADMQGLRDLLLYHLDDMDDILAAAARQERAGGGGLSRPAFQAAVRQAVQGRPIAQDELDLLFRVYDADRDGFIRAAELSAAAARWSVTHNGKEGRLE